jgi:hypothetical protein
MLGIALLLAPAAGDGAFARLELGIEARAHPPSTMEDGKLEALRAGNPTGRALPLLRALAAPVAATIALEYLNDSTLTVALNVP